MGRLALELKVVRRLSAEYARMTNEELELGEKD